MVPLGGGTSGWRHPVASDGRDADVLAVNTGSSSLKVALYRPAGTSEAAELLATAERVGSPGGRLRLALATGETLGPDPIELPDHAAALAAVRGGTCVDTTMGFTPAGSLPMGTRSGDLDPSVPLHLLRSRGLDAEGLGALLNERSGLLGVSGTSADMRDLLGREARDPRAAEAIGLFCYAVKKHLGALVAALGGLDTLVFTGGIGEHAAPVRERICAGLRFLGVRLDPDRNANGEGVVSGEGSRVTVRVIPTDENLMVARHTRRLIMRKE